MRTRIALPAGLLATVVALTAGLTVGCTAADPGSGNSGSVGPATVTVGTITRTRSPSMTVTRTRTGSPTGSAPTGSTSPTTTGMTKSTNSTGGAGPGSSSSGPAGGSSSRGSSAPISLAPFPTAEPTQGDCPFLKGADVSLLSGQRVGRKMLIAAAPQPICVFYRIVDGGWLGAVRVIDAGSPQGAVAAVDAAVPPASSSPADQPKGWGGGYQLLPKGDPHFPDARAVYAVSKGSHAVIAWNSRDQTIRSRRLVEATITSLHW